MGLFEKIFGLFKKRFDSSGSLKFGLMEIMRKTQKADSLSQILKIGLSDTYNDIISGKSYLYFISMEGVMKEVDMKSIISECIAKYSTGNIPSNWKHDIIIGIVTSSDNNKVILAKAFNIEGTISGELEVIVNTLEKEHVAKIVPENS